ncbi:hypothetical protein PAAG_11713 [Paracoccidioides lutzii Pb01]|uniref:Uncharacterized protein n=1 Tax=Paracoccidioides lutzii (strain ATCC MYA-826 / Pb01) TaxID=502779 RepID=A0A0A2V660_PARBA|nr:hypothetical protein PAAG_11713 [Paracoccidioides lutzii Pb01]KGQ01585.1 hypothetical protein PAAG_11713 [Paracoccidioides lutzii Pb01]
MGLLELLRGQKVLLLEAGDNKDRNLRVGGRQWLNTRCWRLICTNFGIYTFGARDGYDEWTRIVGDDPSNWKHIQAWFKKPETFHDELPAGVDKKYVAPKMGDHCTSGHLHVRFADSHLLANSPFQCVILEREKVVGVESNNK